AAGGLIAAARNAADAATVESFPLYRRNVRPIRHIREELGLTYLYTQVLGGPKDIRYILDGSQGEDHSPLGSTDDLPRETVAGLRRVQANGSIYVSPIEYQEQWGLLKTAAAPVVGSDGRIAASAGADVNISVIQVATQNALFMSAMIGIGSVLACLLAALVLVRRIAGPIEALTEDTLQIAGGHTPVSGVRPGPREVKTLRKALDTLAGSLTRSARQRDRESMRREETARATVLAGQTGNDGDEPVLLVSEEKQTVAWIADRPSDPRTVLAGQAMANLGRKCRERREIREIWRDLADFDHGICIILDHQAGTVESLGASRITLALGNEPLTLEPGSRIRFDPGESVTLIRAGKADFRLWQGGIR
ncbi:MAG: histidine kinase, partial [Novosphingobium sp.]